MATGGGGRKAIDLRGSGSMEGLRWRGARESVLAKGSLDSVSEVHGVLSNRDLTTLSVGVTQDDSNRLNALGISQTPLVNNSKERLLPS